VASSPPETKGEFQHLGLYLADARARCGLTQEQLAERCGLTQAHISRFEQGERWPTLAQLTRLARALGVPLQWFVNGCTRPGNDWRELALELYHLGVVDVLFDTPLAPGAFRPPEQVLALVLRGDRPNPRLVEALPAVLAWNPWHAGLLEAYGSLYDPRGTHRLAWLADVALTIHQHHGFPGGCADEASLADFLKRIPPPQASDSLGFPAEGGKVPPVSRRWKITYAADLAVFRSRAEHLHTLRSGPPSPPKATRKGKRA
jgi:transcriptional regulator with XRE-family HTH domain